MCMLLQYASNAALLTVIRQCSIAVLVNVSMALALLAHTPVVQVSVSYVSESWRSDRSRLGHA